MMLRTKNPRPMPGPSPRHAGVPQIDPTIGSTHMHALLTLFLYLTPFVLIGVAAKRWMAQNGTDLATVRAEGDPRRKRSRFLLGIWRHEPE